MFRNQMIRTRNLCEEAIKNLENALREVSGDLEVEVIECVEMPSCCVILIDKFVARQICFIADFVIEPDAKTFFDDLASELRDDLIEYKEELATKLNAVLRTIDRIGFEKND